MRGRAIAMTKAVTKRRVHVIVTCEMGIVKQGRAVVSMSATKAVKRQRQCVGASVMERAVVIGMVAGGSVCRRKFLMLMFESKTNLLFIGFANAFSAVVRNK